MLVDYKKHPSISTGCLAAMIGGGATAVIGAVLFAAFGLFLFGDRYPFLATLGALGLSLAILFFPVFVPVSGLLTMPTVAVLLVRRDGRVRPRSFMDQRPLVAEIRELTLPANAADLTVSIPLSAIQEGFRRVRMGGSRETVIVGPMDFRIRAQLSLLASDSAQASATLPSESPARRSEVERTIRLELGRF